MSIKIRKISSFKNGELADITDATIESINDGIGFNWMAPAIAETIESYWKGVLVVPERELFGGWVDGALAGAIQLVHPGKSKETSSFSVSIEAHFVAPWARGHGLARALLDAAEREAVNDGFSLLRLSVRETQNAAIRLYQENGFIRWGILPYSEFVNGRMIAGHFFYKKLEQISQL